MSRPKNLRKSDEKRRPIIYTITELNEVGILIDNELNTTLNRISDRICTAEIELPSTLSAVPHASHTTTVASTPTITSV